MEAITLLEGVNPPLGRFLLDCIPLRHILCVGHREEVSVICYSWGIIILREGDFHFQTQFYTVLVVRISKRNFTLY